MGQMDKFASADVVLQERQLVASAAARLCDAPTGPMAIGYGGARGGGKSHWLLAQMGADDCQRVPGLKSWQGEFGTFRGFTAAIVRAVEP
jgi:hypothetical protein